jgi:hypothetical protein
MIQEKNKDWMEPCTAYDVTVSENPDLFAGKVSLPVWATSMMAMKTQHNSDFVT